LTKYLSRIFSSLILLTFFAVIGCGYHFGPGGENIDKNIRTAFVENFQNNTSEPHLETYLRKAFNDRLIKTIGLKLAADRNSADAVLKGQIKTVAVSPVAHRSDNVAAIERITITMEIFLEEQNTKKIIWRDQGFSCSVDFDVNAVNLAAKQNTRKNALITLSNDAAERALRIMMLNF
jgi:hypothetical protein